MNNQTIVCCVVALVLGMLLANMLKNVCGCKVVEGQQCGCVECLMANDLLNSESKRCKAVAVLRAREEGLLDSDGSVPDVQFSNLEDDMQDRILNDACSDNVKGDDEYLAPRAAMRSERGGTTRYRWYRENCCQQAH